MPEKASATVLKEEDQIAPLSIIALEGAKELGDKINRHLMEFSEDKLGSFIIPSKCPRFSSGDAKGSIIKTVRGRDLHIIVDVGNYSRTYKMFGELNKMSPDDHFQDLKRIIQALGGKAHKVNVMMPILYGGRQHKRNGRESLDCAVALQELERMGVDNIVTCDAHDSRVCNAIPLTGFDNVLPYYQVLKAVLKNVKDLKVNKDCFMVVSPDEGAIHRNEYFSSVFGVELGMFYKRRNYSKIKNGNNPIVAHEYLGSSVKGKDILVSDDIISSGASMIKVASELKDRGAKRILAYATYPIFTNGLDSFDKAYKEGLIDFVFGTNLTYRTPELLSREWFYEVDMSKYLAYVIAALNQGTSISMLMDMRGKVKTLFDKYNIKGAEET